MKLKPYRGHTIKRQSVGGFQMMLCAYKNGVRVAKAYSLAELHYAIDKLAA